MERPNFTPIFSQKSDFCERSSSKPVKSFVPHQALTISELVRRFERGQRLGIHENFRIEDETTNGCVYEETFEEAPPICHDVVDVHEAYKMHQSSVEEFRKKRKKAKEEAKPKQADEEPTPPPTD